MSEMFPQRVVPRDKSAVTAVPATTRTPSAVMLTIHFFQNVICAGDGPTEVRRHSEDSISRLNNGERQYAAIRLCGCSTPDACRVYVVPPKIRRPAPRPALG